MPIRAWSSAPDTKPCPHVRVLILFGLQFKGKWRTNGRTHRLTDGWTVALHALHSMMSLYFKSQISDLYGLRCNSWTKNRLYTFKVLGYSSWMVEYTGSGHSSVPRLQQHSVAQHPQYTSPFLRVRSGCLTFPQRPPTLLRFACMITTFHYTPTCYYVNSRSDSSVLRWWLWLGLHELEWGPHHAVANDCGQCDCWLHKVRDEGKLARWWTASCVLALAYRPSI